MSLICPQELRYPKKKLPWDKQNERVIVGSVDPTGQVRCGRGTLSVTPIPDTAAMRPAAELHGRGRCSVGVAGLGDCGVDASRERGRQSDGLQR